MTPTSHLVRSLEDVQTEVLMQDFADRILLLITQVGKVGNLVRRIRPLICHPRFLKFCSDPSLYPAYRASSFCFLKLGHGRGFKWGISCTPVAPTVNPINALTRLRSNRTFPDSTLHIRGSSGDVGVVLSGKTGSGAEARGGGHCFEEGRFLG